MRNQDDRCAFLAQGVQPLVAFLAEEDIPDRQGFIDQQNIRIHPGRDREGQPHEHSAGIQL